MKKSLILFAVCIIGFSCRKTAKKEATVCPQDESCQVCHLCIENKLDKEFYMDKAIQNDKHDTFRVGKTTCIDVTAYVTVKYDKESCTKTQNNYSIESVTINNVYRTIHLDRCSKKFTARFDANHQVELVDETP